MNELMRTYVWLSQREREREREREKEWELREYSQRFESALAPPMCCNKKYNDISR